MRPSPPQLQRGVLIAFEGIDGAGKSTQARRLHAALTSLGLEVLLEKEPTDGPWGRKLRASAKTGRLDAEAELELFMADRREHVEQVLNPALKARKVVLVDRYYPSTVAYQGARGLDPKELLAANEAFAPRPDLTILLEVSLTTSQRRIGARDGQGNEFEGLESLRAVSKQFDRMELPGLARVDGGEAEEAVAAAVARLVRSTALFNASCFKLESLNACEPAFCSWLASGRCHYDRFGALDRVKGED